MLWRPGSAPADFASAVAFITAALLAFATAVSSGDASAASSDLAVSISADARAGPDGTITYALTASNLGPDLAQLVALTVLLPPGTKFQSASAPAFWEIFAPPTIPEGEVTILPPAFGGSASFEIKVAVAGAGAGSVLTATVTIDSTVPDPDPSNNSARASTAIGSPAQSVAVPTLSPLTAATLVMLTMLCGWVASRRPVHVKARRND